MNVAFLSSLLSRDGGGVQSAMAGLATALADAGHAVDVLGVRDAALADDLPDWGGARVHAGARRGPRAFGYAPGAAARLRSIAPDVVHQHGLWTHASLLGRGGGTGSGTGGGAGGMRSRAPRVLSTHNMLDPWALGLGAARKRLALALYERRNLERAGCVHALTAAEAGTLRAFGIGAPLCIIPNGVAVPAPGATPPALPPALAAAIGDATGDVPYLLYLGRLHAVKNLAALADAWGRLERAGTLGAPRPWRLIVAGWGSPAETRALAAAMERHGLVHARYVGGVFGAAKHALYARAAAFVLPSLSEGLPMAALEAMAHGVPTLVSAACNLPSRALERDAARVAPTDAAGLAEALAALVALPPGTRTALGARGRSLVLEELSWRTLATRFVAVYRWLRDGGAPPADVRVP